MTSQELDEVANNKIRQMLEELEDQEFHQIKLSRQETLNLTTLNPSQINKKIKTMTRKTINPLRAKMI